MQLPFKFDVTGFEITHQHTVYSTLDGISDIFESASYLKQINQNHYCITDHGIMGAIPQQIKACEKYNLSPIFGEELYVNNMQESCKSKEELQEFVSHLSDEDKKKWRKSCHLLAIAYNNIGYKNLVKLSSWGYTDGYGGLPRRPRVNYEQLNKHKEGIIFTSCCYMSEIGQAFDESEEKAWEMIDIYYKMFGENFRLEIMLLDFKKQKPYNEFLLKVHEKYHIPIELATDSHYTRKEDSKFQKYMLMVRTENTIKNLEEALKKNEDPDKFFELQDTNLWMKSEDEVNEKWLSDYRDSIPYEIFCQAKTETVRICEKAKNVELDRSLKMIQFPNADEILKEEIFKGFKWRGLSGNQYMKRLSEEYEIIVRKSFSSYFLLVKDILDEARRIAPKILGYGNGSDVLAPGRGSCAGSLVAYCLRIHDVDPIRHDLLFSRFISEARGGKQLKQKFSRKPIGIRG